VLHEVVENSAVDLIRYRIDIDVMCVLKWIVYLF
jgi:hypothetical protein